MDNILIGIVAGIVLGVVARTLYLLRQMWQLRRYERDLRQTIRDIEAYNRSKKSND
mgnify:FL=1